MFSIKKEELYQEFGIYDGDIKLGEVEIDIPNKCLSRLTIYEPYQDQGYGTKVVSYLTKKYGLTNLWVRSDNARAIHVYEKCGYEITGPSMYLMEIVDDQQ